MDICVIEKEYVDFEGAQVNPARCPVRHRRRPVAVHFPDPAQGNGDPVGVVVDQLRIEEIQVRDHADEQFRSPADWRTP